MNESSLPEVMVWDLFQSVLELLFSLCLSVSVVYFLILTQRLSF